MRSGISWSPVQSPPPIALPARALASATPWKRLEPIRRESMTHRNAEVDEFSAAPCELE